MIRRDEAPGEGNGEVAEGDAADAAGGRHDPARRLVEEGRHTEAAELYSAAVTADPQDVGALLGLGSVLLSLARYEDAERELRRALRIAPEMGTVRHQLGITLFRRGVYSTAATELRRVVELDSDNAAAYLLLGEALNQLGDPDAAIEALEHALRLQPRNSRIYYALGISYDRKGVPERAAEMYRLSRELGSG
ncbi:hypothetical protein BH24GEM3_BH24GEM3_16230 [soil metagenome]